MHNDPTDPPPPYRLTNPSVTGEPDPLRDPHAVQVSKKTFGERVAEFDKTAVTGEPDPSKPIPVLDDIATLEDIVNAGGAVMGDPEAGDPFVAMGEGMMPMPETTDKDRLIAAYDLISRLGLVNFVVGYDDEEPEEAWWFARVETRDGSEVSEVKRQGSPDEAAERLARKLVNGGRCTACARPTTLSRLSREQFDQLPPVSVVGVCHWVRTGKQWVRGCIDTHAEFQATETALQQEGR